MMTPLDYSDFLFVWDGFATLGVTFEMTEFSCKGCVSGNDRCAARAVQATDTSSRSCGAFRQLSHAEHAGLLPVLRRCLPEVQRPDEYRGNFMDSMSIASSFTRATPPWSPSASWSLSATRSPVDASREASIAGGARAVVRGLQHLSRARAKRRW